MDDFGIEVNILIRVVALHEAAHALVRLGIDADGKRFSTKEFQQVDAGADPSPLLELLAHLFCYHAVKNDAAVLACFIRLGEYQPETYTSWQLLKDHLGLTDFLGGCKLWKRNVAILGYESKKRRGFSAKTSL